MRAVVLVCVLISAGCSIEDALIRCGERMCPAGSRCGPANECQTPMQVAACDDTADGLSCALDTVVGTCRNGACQVTFCGNQLIEGDEVCDDGNVADGDGCSATCLSLESCGNAIRDLGEQCDDGNLVDADGCQASCALPRCGDAIVDPGEMCDDGNLASQDGCRGDCQSDEQCGNAILDLGEACDLGAGNSLAPDAGCRPGCLAPGCGDQIVDTGEACDDGNLLPGDGCTPGCASNETCGNGVLDFFAGELCDDGAAVDHDGCSSECMQEAPEVRAFTPVTPAPAASGAVGQSLAYDPRRDRVVYVMGSDTWEWDGRQWIRTQPARSPPPREGHALVYDARRGVVVLFGGYHPTENKVYGDTWSWDGTSWTQWLGLGPGPRASHAMAYDAARGKVVLYGGTAAAHDQLWIDVDRRRDTWEWDGGWTQRDMSGPPGERAGHAMAYDPVRNVTVMVGGYPYTDATWEWNGTVWATIDTPRPVFSDEAALAYDPVRGKVVMHGGGLCCVWDYGAAETLSWDGVSWTAESVAGGPSRYGHGLAFDLGRRQLVTIGGAAGLGIDDQLWTLGGASWTPRANPSSTIPTSCTSSAEVFHAVTYDRDRGRVVLVNAAGTWEWDGAGWELVTTSGPRDSSSGLAYDEGRRVTVLVRWPNETWEWNGTAWTNRQVASPGAAQLIYDPVRARIVSLGDQNMSEWDGTSWTPRAGFAPLGNGVLVYDRDHAQMLFMGTVGDDGDTLVWSLTNSTFTNVSTQGLPITADGRAFGYNPMTRRVVATGTDGVWELRGATWVQAQAATGMHCETVIGDPISGALLVMGEGSDPDGSFVAMHSLFRFDASVQDAACAPYGDTNCSDAGCWARCTPACSPAQTVACDPTDGSRCGDGVCGVLETCALCPSDCGTCGPLCGDYRCDAGESGASCPGDCS